MTPISPAENIIMNKLGGLTKTAKLLSTDEKVFPVSTVQGWKDRGKIPQGYWMPIIEAARSELSVELDVQMFLQSEPVV
ncbi:hypothetical protein RHSP_31755 [Rhizobium freirei PRF 81]|uniref:Uncharacterized protein n=1 Tax=Rhizobium freirei PRF 81 TaxID=363754 RepID=N6U062_9HYPH|nr:hypothetical protein [Rhizobium freirei]ENN86039.1 hypothetical protein RHSP_31755 [Rhizobium freirei PRF 81]